MRNTPVIVAFVIGTAVSLASIAIVNRSIDPARLFADGEHENAAAKALADGQHLVGAVNLDIRLLQRYLALKAHRPPSVLVLGSSRSWEVGSNIYSTGYLLNQSVPAADIDDLKGLLGGWRKRALTPAVVVLGIDPWMFNQARTTGLGYVKPSFAYDNDIDAAGLDKLFTWRGFRALFSLRYFVDSFRAWRARNIAQDAVVFSVAEHDRSNAPVFRPDGTYKHSRKVRERPVVEINSAAKQVGRSIAFWGLENFSGLDPVAQTEFEDLLDKLGAMGTDTVLFLPPYHPAAYQTIIERDKYRIVLEVERYLRFVATNRSLKIVGSYDPARTNCTNVDFVDHHHPRRSCVERAFRIASEWHGEDSSGESPVRSSP